MGHLTPNQKNSRTPLGILTNFLDEIDIVIASLPEIPETKLTQPIIHLHEQTLKRIVRLIQILHNVQPTGTACILANTASPTLYSHIQHGLTPNITLDAPPCSSATYRQTHICQHIISNEKIQEKFNQLPIPTITINDRLLLTNILQWKTKSTFIPSTISLRRHTIPPLPLNIALPKLVSYPNLQAKCVRYGIPSPGLMYFKDTLTKII